MVECSTLLTDALSGREFLVDIVKFPCSRQNFVKSLAKHGIYQYSHASGLPVPSKFRHLSAEKLEGAKQAFSEMEQMGLCQLSNTWASPLHMVRNPGDYRCLNLQTVPDHYLLPNMANLTSQLNGASIFSKVDLFKV